MASLTRPTEATYVIHEKVTVDTSDREDHTFCGIMFPVKCKNILPIKHLVINSLAIRGELGPITVWITKKDASPKSSKPSSSLHSQYAAANNIINHDNTHNYNLRQRYNTHFDGTIQVPAQSTGCISMKPEEWNKIYEKNHSPSFHHYVELDLSQNPIILQPGEVRGVYIHSSLPGDTAIVYDNKHNLKSTDDNFLCILPGRAHVSPTPFGTRPIWGWGNAWRDSREFVGRISYGVVYKLWNPNTHLSFGDKFQEMARTLFACQRRSESPISKLPDDCIFYILNMCHWQWSNDCFQGIVKSEKKRRKKLMFKMIEKNIKANEANGNNVQHNDEENDDVKMLSTSEINHVNRVPFSDAFYDPNDNDDDDDNDNMESEYDEDEDEDEDDYSSESDDGYPHHTGSSTFVYTDFDDLADSDSDTNISNFDTNISNFAINVLDGLNVFYHGGATYYEDDVDSSESE